MSGVMAPTYQSGFASPQRGRMKYPSLWRGCVGAWAPCLGPTGLTLRDWSEKRSHGAVIGITASNVFTTSSGRYALQFSGASGYVNCGRVPSVEGVSNLTASWWFKQNSLSQNVTAFSRRGASGSDAMYFGVSGGLLYLCQTNTSTAYATYATNDTLWHHVVALFDGTKATNATRMRLVFDGVEVALSFVATIGTTVTSNTNDMFFGRFATAYSTGLIDDLRLYNRTLTVSEAVNLYRRPGIAYELAPRRRANQIITGNRRRRMLIGAN